MNLFKVKLRIHHKEFYEALPKPYTVRDYLDMREKQKQEFPQPEQRSEVHEATVLVRTSNEIAPA